MNDQSIHESIGRNSKDIVLLVLYVLHYYSVHTDRWYILLVQVNSCHWK